MKSPLTPQGGKTTGEALARNLEEQAEGYRAYAVLLGEQRQALMQGDLARLSEANASIDAAVSNLLRLEVDRECLARAALNSAGVKTRAVESWARPAAPESPTKCAEIAVHLPPASAQRLLRARAALRGVLAEVEQTARVNAALAENGQRLVAATLASLTVAGRSAGDLQNVYTRKSAFGGRRQARDLINRKA